MDAFCGIDWAEDHHDIALVDRDGQLLARARISDDAAGLARLLELLAEHGDSPEEPVPVHQGDVVVVFGPVDPAQCVQVDPPSP